MLERTSTPGRLLLALVAAIILAGVICSVMLLKVAPDILKLSVMSIGIPLALLLAVLLPWPQVEHYTPGTGEAELGMLLFVSAFICWLLLSFIACFAMLGGFHPVSKANEPIDKQSIGKHAL